ncbi:uncharacterized protein T551_00786 [Pneumocystis jirovecii RU7]|uniref:XPG N-terminal domain-containing protein n=1 Tax=Pneumocystis jirovecii (strain RU7) TaxID=1408657 RepID=A0A0W4ZUS3_PNEJ7|nr:uncharacterized protein T551_00786 [Pneumocystis jirovecii RU7]KTW32104.1 hypothetical protein T551_00786 [Pneumocystis jirovecii RU7]
MGVKYLISFIRRFSPSSIKKVSEKELRYKTLAIDGTLLLRRGFASPWISTVDKCPHVVWALYLARICRFYKVTPIIVFDGRYSAPAKTNEKIRRMHIKENNRRLLVEKTRQAARLKKLLKIAYQISELNINDKNFINLFLKKAIQAYNGFKYDLHDSNFYQDNLKMELQTWIRDELFVCKNENFILEKLINQIIDYIYDIFSDFTPELMSEFSILDNLLDPYAKDMLKHDLEKRQISINKFIQKLSRRLSSPTWEQINQTKTIFEILGITVLTSPPGYEAEAVASSLVNSGIADFVVTEDTDVLVLNAKMLRGFMSMRGLANKNSENSFFPPNMFMIDPIDVRLNLDNISLDSFIDFAILCGTDFCNTIHGLGCYGAFFLIQKYQNIELVLENLSEFKTKSGRQKYIAPENYIQEVQVARKVFKCIPHTRFYDSKLTVPDVPWFNITENDWKMLENNVIKEYKLDQFEP